MRTGALSEQRVDLAAYCGQPGCRAVVEHADDLRADVLAEWTEIPGAFWPWAFGFTERFGREAAARAAFAKESAGTSAEGRPAELHATHGLLEAWWVDPSAEQLEPLLAYDHVKRAFEASGHDFSQVVDGWATSTLGAQASWDAPPPTWAEAMCEELVSWALGLGDPVAERVAARRRPHPG